MDGQTVVYSVGTRLSEFLRHNLYVKINTSPIPLSPFNTCLAFHNTPRADTLLSEATITASAAGRAAADWHF